MRSTFKVLFYLKRNKEKSQPVVPVMGRITVNGTIAQFSAKLTVPEQLWEVRGGRAKGRSLEADRINRHLDNIRTQIESHYREICDRENYVTAEKVKNAWQGFGQRYKTLLDAFQHFADNLRKRVGIDRAKCTWYRYNSSIRHLRAFMQHTYRVNDMPLAELEQSFIEQYSIFLKTERGFKPTTVCRYLDCLINIVNISFNSGLIPRNPFASYRYFAPTPERDFLSEEEIRILQNATCLSKSQSRNRDLFLFSCFTGICHKDMSTLTIKQLTQDSEGDWWISSNRCKTDTQYVVKLLPMAFAILDKYRKVSSSDKLFDGMPQVHTINASLKRIARQCGIEKNITFHIARHTYATTICLMNGVSLETLSKMLGHKNITTTQIYAKVTQPMIDREVSRLKEKLQNRFSI